MDAVRTLVDHARLVSELRWQFERAGPVRTAETHISTVLLAGEFAYKLKKPVSLGFLDFSSLAARRHFCAEELRLNRRTAPAIYLDVVPIAGPLERPSLNGAGAAIDYAVRMRRFDETQVFDQLAAGGGLELSLMPSLGQEVARLHGAAAAADPAESYGSPAVVRRWTNDNMRALRDDAAAADDRARIDALLQWSDHELDGRSALIEQRRGEGRVRECHGDLHLGNVVLLDGGPVLFDALEFNAQLRFTDVMEDIAFMWMDLLDHGLEQHAGRFLNAWLEESGDYGGLPLLRYFAVYRALVRARVAQLRGRQPALAARGRVREHTTFAHYLALAERLLAWPVPCVVVMTGLSGSGKSTVAARLADRLGAVRVRSDVERKRLHGVPWRGAARAITPAGLYSTAATQRTYAHLIEVARAATEGMLPVIVDAASLRADERRALRAVADGAGVIGAIVECSAPEAVLSERVLARQARQDDPSDATIDVLRMQQAQREAIGADELSRVQRISTDGTLAATHAQVDALAQRLMEQATAVHARSRRRVIGSRAGASDNAGEWRDEQVKS